MRLFEENVWVTWQFNAVQSRLVILLSAVALSVPFHQLGISSNNKKMALLSEVAFAFNMFHKPGK